MGPILIVGGGPSLREQREQIAAWKGDVFCCNRYVLWKDAPRVPDYYVVSANAVVKGVEPADPPARRERFVVSRRLDQLEGWDTFEKVYKKDTNDFLVPGRVTSPILVHGGATQPGIMTQLAVAMGYRDISLVGIEQRGAGHMYDPEAKLDQTYFIADEERLFSTWRSLKTLYDGLGIRLRDRTPDGRLNDILGYEPLA